MPLYVRCNPGLIKYKAIMKHIRSVYQSFSIAGIERIFIHSKNTFLFECFFIPYVYIYVYVYFLYLFSTHIYRDFTTTLCIYNF